MSFAEYAVPMEDGGNVMTTESARNNECRIYAL